MIVVTRHSWWPRCRRRSGRLPPRRCCARPALGGPGHLRVEVTSAIRGRWLAGNLSDKRADAARRTLNQLRIGYAAWNELAGRIWELRHNVTPYDAAYLALAEARGLLLVVPEGSGGDRLDGVTIGRVRVRSAAGCRTRWAGPSRLAGVKENPGGPGPARSLWFLGPGRAQPWPTAWPCSSDDRHTQVASGFARHRPGPGRQGPGPGLRGVRRPGGGEKGNVRARAGWIRSQAYSAARAAGEPGPSR